MAKAKHPDQAKRFEDIPNIGPAMAGDFKRLGFSHPKELKRKNPYKLYDDLCSLTKTRHDPCVIDTFISAVRFMDHGESKPWWHYTEERKKYFAKLNH